MFYLDEDCMYVDPITKNRLKSKTSINNYIELLPWFGLIWDVPHEGFDSMLWLCTELAHYEASTSSITLIIKKDNDIMEKIIYEDAYGYLQERRGQDSYKSIKRIISQLFTR
jgi:hypothetical protein